MIKKLIVALCLFISTNGMAQLQTSTPYDTVVINAVYPWEYVKSIDLNRNLKYACAFQFGSGLILGFRDAYLFHYDESKFFGLKPNGKAWENKWAKDVNGNPIVGKEKFWQSSRALVFTTDTYHASNFAMNRLNEATSLTYALGHVREKKGLRRKWYNYAIEFAAMFTAKSIGFHTTYEIIFK